MFLARKSARPALQTKSNKRVFIFIAILLRRFALSSHAKKLSRVSLMCSQQYQVLGFEVLTCFRQVIGHPPTPSPYPVLTMILWIFLFFRIKFIELKRRRESADLHVAPPQPWFRVEWSIYWRLIKIVMVTFLMVLMSSCVINLEWQ